MPGSPQFATKTTEIINTQSRIVKARGVAIAPENLLDGLLTTDGTVIPALLTGLSVDANALRTSVATVAKENVTPSTDPLTPESISVAQQAGKDSATLEDSAITPEAFLLGLTKVASKAQTLLQQYDVTYKNLLAQIQTLRGKRVDTPTEHEETSDVLADYSVDLTQRAREGKIDPVIGRDSEIRRIIQILSRRTKNNPVLVGEPGVGKTAVAEGLARRIVDGDVPDSLKGRTLVSLDLNAMVAGAKYRGEFEERLKTILDEIMGSDGMIIPFIDEIHTIVGAGGDSDSGMDAGNIIKPMLARGELKLVGATTLDEYRQYIEKDPALERRFQQVRVDQPSVEDTVAILRGIKDKYEAHHGVRISDSALVAASELSDRYITNRFLPDKAIDLVDEGASKLRMEISSKPEDIEMAQRTVRRLEIEKVSLAKEEDPASKKRYEELSQELSDATADLDVKMAQYEAARAELDDIQQIRSELSDARYQAEDATRNNDFTKTAILEYETIPALEKKLADALDVAKAHDSNLSEEVTEDTIADVVSLWTGVPAGKMMQGEGTRLMQMESVIGSRVFGQDDAIHTVSQAVRRSRAGVSSPDRPIGSFMFLGSTGVGKTELSKAVADFLFDDERSMIRIDMSEYGEKNAVARLIGAPPGYVGYDQGGQLTEAVRRQPYAVVLFDEIEKAHPEVFDIFLQILDEGRLTDSQGTEVDFTNTLIILTSNLGAGGTEEEVHEAVKGAFKPELINRIDSQVIFKPLGEEQILNIARSNVKKITKRMDNKGIGLSITDESIQWLAHRGYDPVYGARPVKRVIINQLEDPLSNLLIEQELTVDDSVTVTLNEKTDSLDVVVQKHALDNA